MADVITCPSGLTGRVRGMKVREERVLADRKLALQDVGLGYLALGQRFAHRPAPGEARGVKLREKTRRNRFGLL